MECVGSRGSISQNAESVALPFVRESVGLERIRLGTGRSTFVELGKVGRVCVCPSEWMGDEEANQQEWQGGYLGSLRR